MNKEKMLYALFLLLLINLAVMVRLFFMVSGNIDKIDTDPLVYSANYYNIDSCTCIIDENTQIFFNKSISITKYQKTYKEAIINFSR